MKLSEKKDMFTYAVISNLASAFVTLLTTFFIPKYFNSNVEQYGMQQIFVFYTGYIGLFHFGLCDGIYLREGGKRYEGLNKCIFSVQFRILFVMLLIETAILMLGFKIVGNQDYLFIAFMIAINVVVQNLYTYFSYILQATGQIKYYALSQITGNITYSVILLLLFCIRIVDYRLVIIAYTCSQLFILLMYLYRCKDMILAKPGKLVCGLQEIITNIRVGCQLLMANIAANLINGIVKFGIQQNWDVVTYGQISLTISISNILLLFISSVSMVLYPILRREQGSRYSEIYEKLSGMLMLLLFGGMIFYYPVMKIACIWLPNYTDGLKFMAVLFPICCYSAKMSMLVLTYMKVMRLERKILYVNVISVAFSCLSTLMACVIFKSLTIAMMAMVFNQMFRCIIAELILSKYIGYKPLKDIIIEVVMTAIFILCSWKVGGIKGVCIYAVVYALYAVVYRTSIQAWVNQIAYEWRRIHDKKND